MRVACVEKKENSVVVAAVKVELIVVAQVQQPLISVSQEQRLPFLEGERRPEQFPA